LFFHQRIRHERTSVVKHLDKALIGSGAALLLSGGIAAAALGPSNVGSAVMASLPGDVALAVQNNSSLAGGKNWLATAAAAIGITEAVLRTDLASGKSLTDVAMANGKSRDDVVKALTAAASAEIQTLVDTKNPLPLRGGGGPGGRGTPGDVDIDDDELAVAATYLGTTEADLKTKMQAGQTLAQIAGSRRDGLIQALVADANTRIDAAVAAGKLTAAQATAAKTRASAEATAFVDNTRPAGVPGLGGPGRGRR
jgi:DNA-binding phage protein